MSRFIPKIFIDYSSFWLGALLAIVIIYLFIRFRSPIGAFFQQFFSKVLSFRDQLSIASSNDYINVLNRYAQGLHTLSGLFPLDQLSVTPRFIAPPPTLYPGEENLDPSLVLQTLGYDPYLPVLAAEYNASTIKLSEALSKNASICLVGYPGSGKTTAIADCISSLISTFSQDTGDIKRIPFYTKAHYILAQFPGSELLEIILAAIQCDQSFNAIPGFPKFLTSAINSGQAVLFIDDLELLNYKDTNRIANFLTAVYKTIPSLQLVATATPSCLGYLSKTPLELISIAPWNNKAKYAYLKRFSRAWTNLDETGSGITIDKSDIQHSMLVESDQFSTTLEFTLKTWAAYAGDIRGSAAFQAIDVYLRRCFPSNTQASLNILETIALHSLDLEISSFTRKDIRSWFSNEKSSVISETSDDKIGQLTPVLQAAHNYGILHRDGADGFYISSPTIGGYLAAKGIRRLKKERILNIIAQPDWSLKHETMRFISVFNPIESILPVIKADQSFMKEKLIQSVCWLAHTKHDSPPEIDLLKTITREIHTNPSYLIKLRLVTALVKSGNPNTKNIVQHLIKSKDLDTRRAVALGAGLDHDISSVPQLISQLNDTFPASTAACYALGRIASPRSLEAIADGLLHGTELLRRASAESLAQNRSEGHPALRDGASREDLLVRYAVVHGLSLINESWALEILDKLRIDEDEWIVRDLAQHVYEILLNGSPYIPENKPSPSVVPWLKSFASKQDLPEPTPETALEVLLTALEVGSEEQKQASIDYLTSMGGLEIIPVLTGLFRHPNPDVRQQAMLTAWQCSPPGYVLPT